MAAGLTCLPIRNTTIVKAMCNHCDKFLTSIKQEIENEEKSATIAEVPKYRWMMNSRELEPIKKVNYVEEREYREPLGFAA